MAPSPRSNMHLELKSHVKTLSQTIGERNCYHPEHAEVAATWIEKKLKGYGYSTSRQKFTFEASEFNCKTGNAVNIVAEKIGKTFPNEVIIVGAHYDSKVATPGWHDHWPVLPNELGTPGANDNGSGIAALLVLAKNLADTQNDKTIRFVAFANEEPPFFRSSKAMGSWHYSRSCREENKKIVGAIILDSLGTYSEMPRAKRKMLGFLPTLIGLPHRKNYVAFLSNFKSRQFVRTFAKIFESNSSVECRSLWLPAILPKISWSDDWAFWQEDFEAFTITDTAFLRSDHYHETSDTYEKLDYEAFAKVVLGIEAALRGLLSSSY